MWNVLQTCDEIDSGLAKATAELVQDTARMVVYATGGICLALPVVAVATATHQFARNITLVMLVPLLTSRITLSLIEDRLLAAQAVWHAGLAIAIGIALWVFRRPEIAFLYALLPFMAVVTVGWLGGLLVEVLIVLASWLFSYGLTTPLLPHGYLVAVALGGTLTGLIGWGGSRSLYTATLWSIHSSAQAWQNMKEARQRRAQLARMVKDLDQAYYRLERANAALVAAWRAADEAERFRAEFATHLSHELRTPLNLIIGFSEMMMTAPHKYEGIEIPRPYRADLNAIYNSAQHLMALVSDVLDLARIDAGKLSLARDEVDLTSLVLEAVDMVRDYVEAKGLQLRTRVEEGLSSIWADRLRVRQVLLNLLVNAARFTEEGSISVRVAGRDGQVVFQVEDTGRGIPEQELPRIFQEFRQTAQPASTGWASGTGLGLPISKKLVELHGGSMGVDSAYLKGTTFWFTLPKGRPIVHEPRTPGLTRREPVKPVRGDDRVVVCLSEDTSAIALLKRHADGYQVVGATSVEEGAALVRETRALAVVTDLGEVPTLPDDVLCIRCPLPSSRKAAEVLGADDLLVKPISHDSLWAAIARVDGPVRRVLVADDDPEMVRLLRRMLGPRIPARDCLEAHNGEEALLLLRDERPDLLLLDLVMPRIDGRQVLEQMRSDPDLERVPVVLISAKGEDEILPELSAPIQIFRRGGWQLSDVLRAVEASLAALARGWGQPGSREPGPAAEIAR